ncbi:hypothetical protein [Amycolatopsis marina]|uniref:hypothetical protein n=1 Tax=Amycolatopsis marina TaxID=490629 RepID=UPI000B809CBD|nr:hypothetical protein [Amycolatopsis marina]
MGVDRRAELARCVLLLVIAFGVLVMHHTPASAEGHPAIAAHAGMETSALITGTHQGQGGGEHGSHGFVHECLAVVAQVALALLAFALVLRLVRTAHVIAPGSLHRARAPDRPAQAGGRSILTSLCVLRV